MSTVFKIAGSTVSVPGTVILGKFIPYSVGSYPTLSFFVRGGPLPALPDPYLGKTATLAIGGTTYFTGDVTHGPDCDYDQVHGWVQVYQCTGYRVRLDYFPHTDSNDGTDTSGFNLQPEDPGYIVSRAGRSVGQILTTCLTMQTNANSANAAGIGNYASLSPPTLSTQTLADLTQLVTIPQSPVYFSGQRFGSAVDALLATWAQNYFFWIDPSTGDYRFSDLRKFTAHTFTLDSDPVEPTPLARSCISNYPRTLVRGGPLIYGILLDTAGGGLTEDFAHDGLTNSQAKSNWMPSDFQSPTFPPGQATGTVTESGGGITTSFTVVNGGYGYPISSTTIPCVISGGGGSGATCTATSNSSGVITGFTRTAAGTGYTSSATVTVEAPLGVNADAGSCTCSSTTQVVVTSANPTMTWTSNFWDASHHSGYIYLNYSAGSGITQYTTRRIIANTALSAGGTSTLTLDQALPITSYDSYEIVGTSGGASIVWRQYLVANATVGAAMANQFSYPQAFRLANGQGALMTSYPIGSVVSSSGTEVTLGIIQNPTTGTILFNQPTYTVAGNTTPTNVRALIGVNQGPQAAYWPADAYATCTLTSGAVSGFSGLVGGSGFGGSTANIYVIGDGSGAVVTATISGGAVTAFHVSSGGSGYTWAVVGAYDPTGSAAVQYAGTSHTQEGLARTSTTTLGAWRDPGNFSSVVGYAYDLWTSMADTYVEGSVRYIGLFTSALTPGLSVNVTGSTFSTGWENPLTTTGTGGLTVTQCTVEWPQGHGSINLTTMQCNNRRTVTSSGAFLRPNRTGTSITGGYTGAGWTAQQAAGAAASAYGGGTTQAAGAPTAADQSALVQAPPSAAAVNTLNPADLAGANVFPDLSGGY